MTLYSPNRVTTPLKRTNPEKGIGVDPKWVEISWAEAIDTVVEKLKKVRAEDPRGFIGQGFNRMFSNDFQFYTAFGSAFGTPNIYMAGAAAYFCGNNLHPVGYLTNGAFHMEVDVEHCNYFMLIGSQHGFLAGEDTVGNAQRVSDARMRGMKLVVVDPICTPAAAKADYDRLLELFPSSGFTADGEMRAALAPLVDLLDVELAAAAAAGDIRPVDRHDTIIVFSLILSHVHATILFTPGQDMTKAAERLWDFALGGLRAGTTPR